MHQWDWFQNEDIHSNDLLNVDSKEGAVRAASLFGDQTAQHSTLTHNFGGFFFFPCVVCPLPADFYFPPSFLLQDANLNSPPSNVAVPGEWVTV